jgi:site-specific DNA recombinase
LPVVQELAKREWVNKCWQTRKGHIAGGKVFDRGSVYRMLNNVAYIGKVRYKDEVHDGQHAGIIDPGVFQRVQALLRRNGATCGAPVRNKFGALLRGLIRCVSCDCAMSPSLTTRKKKKRYRYYICASAQRRGWDTCTSKSVPAGEIEAFVVEQIRYVGRDRRLFEEVLAQARKQDETRTGELEAEQRELEKDLTRWHAEVRKLSVQIHPGENNNSVISRLADLQDRIAVVENRVRRVHDQIHAIHHTLLDAEEAAKALAIFDPVWESLTPHEQARVIELLVERVDYDGAQGKVAITFCSTGIKTLAQELADQREEQIA